MTKDRLSPLDAAGALLRRVPAGCPIIATGYGRDLLAADRNVPTITEIKAHAAGARFLAPQSHGAHALS